jgi:predicted ATPase with chaperone activity
MVGSTAAEERRVVLDLERTESPTSIHETGLDPGFLADLTLKTLYFGGNISGSELVERMSLSLNVVSEVLDFLRKQRLVETTGGVGLSAATLQYALSNAGQERASAALALSGYVGPAPVPLEAYFEQVRRQSVLDVEISRHDIEASLRDLVLSDKTLALIGQALSSKKATMIYGASGNGKSTMAEALRDSLSGEILIPYAIEVMHQVIQVYDHSVHQIVQDTPKRTSAGRIVDPRWITIKRPVVLAAGELAPSHLELILDETYKTYEAPIQMKANGGILVIDDFGRQNLDAAYLLNRWIVPLEKGLDNLSLRNGARFQTPFDVIPLFVTNKRPNDLVDEGFLRRIRYKVEIPSPTPELFFDILKKECQRNGVAYDQKAAEYLLETHFDQQGREIRGCQPRDIVEAIAAAARYQSNERALTRATIDDACSNYFV